jgi:hypothetical protein
MSTWQHRRNILLRTCQECSAVTARPRCKLRTLEIGNTWFTTTFPSLYFSIFCQITEFSHGPDLWDTIFSSDFKPKFVYVFIVLWNIHVNIHLIISNPIPTILSVLKILWSFKSYGMEPISEQHLNYICSALCISFYVWWSVRLQFLRIFFEREGEGGGLWDTNAVKESGSDKNLWASVALLLS